MFKKGNEIFEERLCELNNVYSQSLNSVYFELLLKFKKNGHTICDPYKIFV